MEDETKTKEQLIEELAGMRQRTTELEASETERNRLEGMLRESQNRYQTIFETAGTAILIIGEDTTVLLVNTEFEKLSGYSKEELQGKRSWTEFVTKDDLERMKEYHRLRRIDPNSVPDKYECRLIDKRGNVRNALLSIAIIPGANTSVVSVSDITERKRAEDELRESEERLRDFLDNANDLIQSVAPDGRLLYVNRTWRDNLGYTEEEIAGLSLFDIVHPDSLGHCMEVFQHVLAGHRVDRVEAKFVTKDGRTIMVEGSVNCRFEDGKPVATRGLFRDITERKQMEEELGVRGSALASSINAIALADLEGDLIYVNPAFLILWGYDSEEEVLGKRATELWHAEEQAVAVIEALFEKGGWLGELLASRKDGSVFDAELSASIVVGENGKHVCMFASFIDITARKRAEGELRELEEKYRQLIENIPDVVFASDENGVVTYVSPGIDSLIGYKQWEVIGQSFAGFILGDDLRSAYDSFQRILAGEVQVNEYRALTKWGEIRWIRTSSRPAYDGSRVVGAQGVISDITKWKQASDELQRQHEVLRELYKHFQSVREEERTSIAREIHDELGQALAALKMDVSWLKKRLGKADKPLTDKMRVILGMIDEIIRTLKRISLELRPGVLDDLGLVAAVEWQTMEFQKRTGIKCRLNLGAERLTVSRDLSTALFRILQEALTNVARHANATTADVSLLEKAGRLVMEVRDNGKGIHEDQVSDPRSFGLIGIRERIYSQGGDVKINGIPKKGTMLTVSIPFMNRDETDDKNTGC